MDAHKALIKDIFNGSTFVEIPFFQRNYVWEEDLWERLLQDMEFIVKSQKPHFFGSIILKEGEKPKQGQQVSSILTVVDGQQRLTTFLIFLKVLCLKLNETTLFDFQFRIMGKEIALRHGKNDVEAFEKVMAAEKADIIENPEPKSKIIEAYNYFVEKINPELLDIMTIETNTQFVRIDLNADEDEQQIFDTINSLGVNLTTSELLKNYFFSRETVQEYDEKWAAVFEKDDDTKIYWDQEIEAGRNKRAMIDIFFDAYFQIFIQNKKYNISTEDKLYYSRIDKLAQSYQHFIKNYCNGNKDEVLKPLKDYALCFMETFNPSLCKSGIPSEYGVERINVIIFGLKTTTLIPYILYLVKNIEDKDNLNEMMRVIESYIMRRMVTHESTKNYNNLFISLILNNIVNEEKLVEYISKSADSTTYIPDNDILKEGFLKSKLTNLQTKGILYLIESRIRPKNSATVLLGFDNYSLEHLMPKKWRNNWPACDSEDKAIIRDRVLLTLGNLAIITQALNASIRDADWSTKRSGKGENKPGLDKCAAGLATFESVLNKEIWNEDIINQRAEELYNWAKQIWSISE